MSALFVAIVITMALDIISEYKSKLQISDQNLALVNKYCRIFSSKRIQPRRYNGHVSIKTECSLVNSSCAEYRTSNTVSSNTPESFDIPTSIRLWFTHTFIRRS